MNRALRRRQHYRIARITSRVISGISLIALIGIAGASDIGNVSIKTVLVGAAISAVAFAVFATLGYICSQYEKDCRRLIRYKIRKAAQKKSA